MRIILTYNLPTSPLNIIETRFIATEVPLNNSIRSSQRLVTLLSVLSFTPFAHAHHDRVHAHAPSEVIVEYFFTLTYQIALIIATFLVLVTFIQWWGKRHDL